MKNGKLHSRHRHFCDFNILIKAFYRNCIFIVSVLTALAGIILQRSEFQFLTSNCYLNVLVLNSGYRLTVPVMIPGTACFSYYQDIIMAFAVLLYPVVRILLTVFRWFKFTLKPPYSIAHDKLRLAIWDTSFWTFWLKFGHKGP